MVRRGVCLERLDEHVESSTRLYICMSRLYICMSRLYIIYQYRADSCRFPSQLHYFHNLRNSIFLFVHRTAPFNHLRYNVPKSTPSLSPQHTIRPQYIH
jgi:hypothetical protein